MTSAHDDRGSRLPHALVALYAAAIAYASLQPFGDWMKPLPDTPFWLLGPEPARTTNFDIIVNMAPGLLSITDARPLTCKLNSTVGTRVGPAKRRDAASLQRVAGPAQRPYPA